MICIDHPELLYWYSWGLYTCGEIVSAELLVPPPEQVDISLAVVVEEDNSAVAAAATSVYWLDKKLVDECCK